MTPLLSKILDWFDHQFSRIWCYFCGDLSPKSPLSQSNAAAFFSSFKLASLTIFLLLYIYTQGSQLQPVDHPRMAPEQAGNTHWSGSSKCILEVLAIKLSKQSLWSLVRSRLQVVLVGPVGVTSSPTQ